MPLPPEDLTLEPLDPAQIADMYRARSARDSVSVFWSPQSISMRRSDKHATLYELEREFGYEVMLGTSTWVPILETPKARQARRSYYERHKSELAAMAYWG